MWSGQSCDDGAFQNKKWEFYRGCLVYCHSSPIVSCPPTSPLPKQDMIWQSTLVCPHDMPLVAYKTYKVRIKTSDKHKGRPFWSCAMINADEWYVASYHKKIFVHPKSWEDSGYGKASSGQELAVKTCYAIKWCHMFNYKSAWCHVALGQAEITGRVLE